MKSRKNVLIMLLKIIKWLIFKPSLNFFVRSKTCGSY